MKISIDVDCTPEEARTFLGLPDVKSIQDSLMADAEDRMKKAMKAMDAEALFKMWLPAGMQGLEQMQKAFFSQMTGAGKKGKDRA